MLVLNACQILLKNLDIYHNLQIQYQLQQYYKPQMGAQTSKIKDFIYVTGTSIDPRREVKKDKQKKQVFIDYTTFKSKKYYKQNATQKQINQHLKKIQSKQNILKQFRYYQQFDRMDTKRQYLHRAWFQVFAEEAIKFMILTSLYMGRFIGVQYFPDYWTTGKALNWSLLFIGLTIPLTMFNLSRSNQYHIINHEYFRIMPQQQALYVELDQKLDLYKYVDDIKYNFKYPSLKSYYKERKDILLGMQNTKKSWYEQYFKYTNKLITDPIQQFVKQRETKRKGNWQILTKQQKMQIQKQLSQRQNINKND